MELLDVKLGYSLTPFRCVKTIQDTSKVLIKAMTQHLFSYDKQSLGNTDFLLAQTLTRMMVLEDIFKITFRSA